MHILSYKFLRAAGMVSATSLALLASTQLSAADLSDAFPAFDSYIKVTGQAASIVGDASAFQQRTGQSEFRDGVGIEDFRYSKDLNKTTTFTTDGHALSGSEDYLIHLNLVKAEVGSVDVGYKRFRTFYDGVGGFFPLNNAFTKLTPENLFIDRGEFWAEVNIARPDQPEFKIRYTNGTRSGQKDSTIWGDSDNTGINFGTNPVLGAVSNGQVRKDIPSYLDISERHQTLEGSVKHTMGKTTAQLTLLGDWSSRNNGRFEDRFAGEARVANAAGTGVTPITGALSNTPVGNWLTFNNQVMLTTQDIQDTKTKGINGTTVTELGPKLTLRLGASYQDVDGSFGGDRVLVTTMPITGTPLRQLTTYNVQNLIGQDDGAISTGNVAFDYKLLEDLTVSLGARGEDKHTGSSGTYDITTNPTGGTGAVPVVRTAHNSEGASLDEQSLTPVLDVRYSGIKNVALYSTVSHRAGDGIQDITPAYATSTTQTALLPATLPTTIVLTKFHSKIDESNTDYTVGGNWRVASGLTMRAEPFFKDHDYHASGFKTVVTTAIPPAIVPPAPTTVNTSDYYALESQFYGVKLTVVAKPLDVLSLTTRYIYQKGKMEVTAAALGEDDSMDSTSHTFGETIDWNPIEQFYMQGSADVVFNQIATVSNNPGAYLAPAPGTIPAALYVGDSNNNYMTFSVMAGAVLTKRDDVQVRFTAYRAANSDASIATYTQPYGSSAYENTVTVGLIHKFSAKLIGHVKVGYMNSHNQLTGGNTDFKGPLAYVSLDYGL